MITFLLKASLVVTILLAFYKIFLEKESFFGVNRSYLLACLVLTFVLPFIALPQMVNEQGLVSSLIEEYVYKNENKIATTKSTSSPERLEEQAVDKVSKQVENLSNSEILESENLTELKKEQVSTPLITSNPEPKEGKGLLYWLLLIYFFGVGIFALNFFFQIGNVLLKIFKSTDKIEDVNNVIVNSASMTEPCSFFNFIFINPESYDYDTYEQILAHEKIHVQKRHTYDLLLSEIAVILLWFNPVMWFFRKEVEKNIEYQTDDILLKGEIVEKENYQMNLLKVATYSMPLTITTNYNQSLIKQRIMKINAKKSNPQSLWKYSFTAPLLFLLLLFINKPVSVFAKNEVAEVITSKNDLENIPTTREEKTTTESTIKPDIATFLSYYKNLSDTDKTALLEQLKGTQKETTNKKEAPVSESSNTFAPSKTTTKIQSNDRENTISENNSEVVLFENMKANEKEVILDILVNMDSADEQVIEDGQLNEKTEKQTAETVENCEALLKAIRNEKINDVKTLLETIDPNCIVVDPGNEVFTEKNITWRILRAQTPLLAAVRVGNFELIKLLVNKGADVNLHGHSNETALMAAAKHGDINMVRFLIKKGAKVKSLVKYWGSAMSVASNEGHIEIVKYLHSNGADIDSRVAHVGTPLIEAAENGHVEIVKFLINNGADVNKKEAHIGTPLICAAKGGQLDVVKCLIEKGADLSDGVAHVGTPLIEAAQNNHLEVVKYLIAKGADINQSIAHVGTPLITATESRNWEVTTYLIEKGAGLDKSVAHVGTPLINAAEDGQLRLVESLIEKGADINKSVAHVGTPLIVAAQDGHLEVVKMLIKKGANIDNAVEHVGTPLICAAQDGHLGVVKFLIENGANIDKEVAHVGTPLIGAASDGQMKVIKYLLEKGANIDKAVEHVGTPLINAASDGRMNVVKYLIAQGADVNKWVQHVGSPLSKAMDNGQKGIAEYLRAKGAKQ